MIHIKMQTKHPDRFTIGMFLVQEIAVYRTLGILTSIHTRR